MLPRRVALFLVFMVAPYLSLGASVFAQTRLYLEAWTAGQPSPVSTAFDAGWEDTNDCGTRVMILGRFKIQQVVNNSHAWTAGQDSCSRQYASLPMEAGITFTSAVTSVKLQMMAFESAANDNATSRLGIRIVNQSGSTVQATLLAVAQYGPATEYVVGAAGQNKTFADGDTVAATYTTVAGDRLLIEVGSSDAAGSTITGTHRTGCITDTTDLPENETATAGCAWVEFSNTITFMAVLVPRRIGLLAPPVPKLRDYLEQENTESQAGRYLEQDKLRAKHFTIQPVKFPENLNPFARPASRTLWVWRRQQQSLLRRKT